MRKSLKITRKIKHSSLARQRTILPLQNLLKNFLSSCCYSLLVPVSVLKHFDASSNESKPLSQLRNSHGPPTALRLRIISFFNGALLPNFKKFFECELLASLVQQLEDNFSAIGTNLRTLA
jgi:hypothetical protein